MILKVLALVMPLRISGRDERLGLDVSDHGEEAYTHGDGAILVKPKETTAAQSASDVIAVQSGGGRMKLIVAIVRPEQLSDVLEALFHAEVRGLTISRVQGHGGEMEHVENYRGTSVKMALAEKVRLEIGVSNHFVQPTIDAILARGPHRRSRRRQDHGAADREDRTASAPAKKIRTPSRRFRPCQTPTDRARWERHPSVFVTTRIGEAFRDPSVFAQFV